MVVSLMSQVATLQKLAIQDAGALNSALSETCFDDAHKLRLATAINIKVNESASSQQCSTRKVTQSLHHPNCYLTEDDWQYIYATAMPSGCARRISDRLQRCGLVAPSEDTLAHMTGMLAAAKVPDATDLRLYEMYMDF